MNVIYVVLLIENPSARYLYTCIRTDVSLHCKGQGLQTLNKLLLWSRNKQKIKTSMYLFIR